MANGHVSDAFADLIIRAVLTRNVSILPASYFIGLTLELPTDQNGTGLVPPAVLEYGRIEVVAEDSSWISSGVGSRTMVSNIDVIFAQAITDWGNLRGYTIHDTLTDGLFLGYGIINPYVLLAGTRPRLPAELIAVALPF